MTQTSQVLTPKKGFTKWIILGVAVLFLLWQFALYGNLVSDEENIKASDQTIAVVINGLVNKLKTAGFTSANYTESLTKVLITYVGEDGRGSAGFINAVTEAIPNVPPQIWQDIMATSNAEYSRMESAQRDKIFRIAEFKKKLRYPQYLIVKAIGGFPTVNLSELDQLILNDEARNAQDTKKLETVDPFKK